MEKMNPVGWFEIYTKDLERAKKFYGQVLQTEFQPGPEDKDFKMAMFPHERGRDGIGGALVQMTGYEPHPGTIVYFSCEDCAVEEKRISGAGGKVQKPKTAIGEYGHISLGVDTEGNIFGLWSMK